MTIRSALETPLVRPELPAEHRYVNIVSACLAALMERVDAIAEREAVVYNIQLAVHEACTNIVDHAYHGQAGGRIKVELSLVGVPRQLIVDLYDNGRPFAGLQTPAPELDEPQTHGYGLFLMQALVDDVQYERPGGRNHWRLSKQL